MKGPAARAINKERVDFDIKRFPSAATFSWVLTLLIIAGGLIAVPTLLPFDAILPAPHKPSSNSFTSFKLDNDVHSGVYRGTHFSGDTTPSLEATYQGYKASSRDSPLSAPTSQLKDFLKNQVESVLKDKSTKAISELSWLLKNFKLLSSSQEDSLYGAVLSLFSETGFKSNAEESPSAEASWYAFQAVENLGKLERFKKASEREALIKYVKSLARQDGGFAMTADTNSSVSGSYYVVRLASGLLAPAEQQQLFQGLEAFLYTCQGVDGGFFETPLEARFGFFNETHSEVSSQAIYLLEYLRSHNLHSTFHSGYGRAHSYIRSHVSAEGVRPFYSSGYHAAGSTYHFLELASTYTVGLIPRSWASLFVGLALAIITIALFDFYSHQLPPATAKNIRSWIVMNAIYLLGTSVLVHFHSGAALIAYLIYGFYLGIKFYELQELDNSDGLMLITAVLNGVAAVLPIFFINNLTPAALTQVWFYYFLAGWATATTFLATYTSSYFSGKYNYSFFVNASYLAWIITIVMGFVLTYGRGYSVPHIARVLTITGQLPIVLFGVPLLTLLGMLAASAAAVFMVIRTK